MRLSRVSCSSLCGSVFLLPACMKPNIHPENYRTVLFFDSSANEGWLIRSCAPTSNTMHAMLLVGVVIGGGLGSLSTLMQRMADSKINVQQLKPGTPEYDFLVA